MKTNKVTAIPRLRFPEFDGDWKIFYLNNVSHNLDSKRVPITSKDRKKGNIPYYGASGIIDYIDEFIFDDNLLCISEDGANLIDRVYPIAFSVTGKTWINNHAHVLKFENLWTQVIVESYLNHISLEKYLTGVAQPKLNKAKLNSIEIPLPKLKEQKKIADCLSSLDDLINAENEQLDALQEYKAGLLQQLFPAEGETTPKLRFAEFKDDGDWEEVKLVDLAETSIGLVTTMTTSYVEKGIPLIRNSDIKPNAIRMTKLINLSKEFADKYENKKLLKNDIVTVHTGDIGVSAIVEQDLEGSLGFATLNTRVTSSNVSPEFVCWFFNSPEYKRFALSMATGDGRNNFNLRDFNKTILFIPDILEQQKIVDCLSSLDNLIQAKDEKIKMLKEHKQGLMQQLFPMMDGE